MAKADHRSTTVNEEPASGDTLQKREITPFTAANYILFAVALVDIVAGWFLLRAGSTTLAPIMLVLGYCGIIPLAILYKRKRSTE
jgi:hypothetical protein